MHVQVNLFGPFRDAVGRKELEREAAEGATLGDILAGLEAEYDELAGRLVEDGELVGSTVVTVDGKHARNLDGAATPLSEGSVVRVTNAVYGG